MTQATQDCTGCPVSAGTHKPADAVHTEIAEPGAPAVPAPQAAPDGELEATQDMLTSVRLELELLREALGVPYEPHQSLFDRMLEAIQAKGVPAAAPDARDAAFEAVRNRLCGLQRYSFVLDDDGAVRRVQDRTGNWIEFDDAHELFDPVSVDAAIAAQAGKGGA